MKTLLLTKLREPLYRLLLTTLCYNDYNETKSAKELGISRNTLRFYMKELNVQKGVQSVTYIDGVL